MGPDRNDAALKRLLADDRWLRDLARRIGGRARADDLVQEAWLATLAGRAPRGSLRAWFAAILRNLARQGRRGEVRRRRREEAAARREGLPGVDELAAKGELRRRLVEAVCALEEPYRSTVLLRFYGGLRAAEIARREQVSASTVRNRLRRALGMLRARLGDVDRGGALLLAPLLALFRPRWAKVAIVVGVVSCAAYAGVSEDEPEPEPSALPAARDTPPAWPEP
jgi:RNA polymerase sigma factor (sigma-70 family)